MAPAVSQGVAHARVVVVVLAVVQVVSCRNQTRSGVAICCGMTKALARSIFELCSAPSRLVATLRPRAE